MTEFSFEFLGLWLLIALLGGYVNALLYPLLSRGISPLQPAFRCAVRLAYAGSAPIAALLSLILITQPSVSNFFVPSHCHGNQCVAHAPMVSTDSALLIGMVTIGSLAAIFALLVLLWALRRAHRRLCVLLHITRDATHGYRVIESNNAFACCVGLLRPQVLVSSALLETLNEQELEIVLNHERAHVARFDNLRALILRWLTLLWPTSQRQRIANESRADAEQACDLTAARASKKPARVAAVIEKLSKLTAAKPAYGSNGLTGVGFHHGDNSERLAVLEQVGAGGTMGYIPLLKISASLALLWCAQIMLLSTFAHKLVEWLAQI